MRPNIERQRVVLDKIREYERLLPILGNIAVENDDSVRAARIDAFRAHVAETRDVPVQDRSFSLSSDEAEKLIRKLNDTGYIHELVESGILEATLTSRQYRHYSLELGSNLGQIYASHNPVYDAQRHTGHEV